jgi:hypothetical protein
VKGEFRNVTKPRPNGRPRLYQSDAERQAAHRYRKAHRASSLSLWPVRDVVAVGRALERAAAQAEGAGQTHEAQLLRALLPLLGITPQTAQKCPPPVAPKTDLKPLLGLPVAPLFEVK